RDRTKTIPIEAAEQAIVLLIYIFLNPVRAGIVGHPRDYPNHNFSMYAEGRSRYGKLFTYHPAFLALGRTWEARHHRFCSLLERALQEWAFRRWEGISGSHGMGRDRKKKCYEAFISLAKNWIGYAKLAPRSPPPLGPP